MPNAKVRIVGEDATAAAWAQALSTAQGAADRMRSLFTGAFAGISLVAITAAVDSALKLGEALEKAGVKAGVSASTMSELAYVGKLAGVSMEELSIGLKKMETAVSMAASGSKQQEIALDALGLSTKNLIGLAPDKMFELIGTRISELKEPTDRARAAVEFFGRAGTDLIPIFEKGKGAIEALRQEARDLGLSLSDDTIKKLADAEESVKKLDTAFSNLWTTLVAKVAPGLAKLSEGLTAALSGDRMKQLTLQLDELQKRKAEIEAQGAKGGIIGALFGPGGYNAGGIDKQIEAVQAQLALQKMALKPSELADVGLPGAGAGPSAPSGGAKGFAEAEAASKQAEEDAKQFKADMKDIAKANDEFMAQLAKSGVAQSKVEKEALDQWLAAYEKRKTEGQKTDDEIVAMRKAAMTETMKVVETFREASKTALDDFLLHGQFTFRKLGAYLLESLAVKELNKALDGIFSAIEDKLGKSGSAGGGGGSWVSTILSYFGFASGGSFDVGGHGSNDSQLVSFMATPGEHVTVGGGDSGTGGNLNFNPVYHIDARGADAERIMSIMPSLLTQTAEKAKRDVLEAFRRNNLPHPPRA